MQTQNRKMRGVAALTGGAILASACFHPAPAQADEKKEKLYKGGAVALGVLGAYFILKGKTVPGAAAGAGAYYAYKKSKDAKNDNRTEDEDDRYSENSDYDYDNSDYEEPDYDYDNSESDYEDVSNDDSDYDGSWRASGNNRTSSGIASAAKSKGAGVVLK